MATTKQAFDRIAASGQNDTRALKQTETQVELGSLREMNSIDLPHVPRYVVTYMNSQTSGRIRSATVVSVTNQSRTTNRVFVTFFKGFKDNTSPVGSCAFAIPPDYTVDFSSRNLPGRISVCNAVSSPELTFDEGRAIVSSMSPEMSVSSRVVYTKGGNDAELSAITDSKVVEFEKDNICD